MCGRYALSLRPSIVRQRLADQDMHADEAADDDDERIRQTYNFAPGYHGLIFRADTSDRGAEDQHEHTENSQHAEDRDDESTHAAADGQDAREPAAKRRKIASTQHTVDGLATKETKYKLQAARWGLIPFWTKRPPDYASQMRTINCRDDSLIENRGMWNTMKQRKRCIVVAEGFYEWLKKNNGKEKVPHFMKRKDGGLMCFAGLWDMVKYEGAEEKLYTYTIITTDSNAQLKFLHDRMPVILEPGSKEMKMWLDPHKVGWSKELQSLLKPFTGELECYPVDKGVGKVGNNSPTFVIPVDSKENKKNIANFFGKAAAKGETQTTTNKIESTEDNAPLPVPKEVSPKIESDESKPGHELKDDTVADQDIIQAADIQTEHNIKQEEEQIDDDSLIQSLDSPVKKLAPTDSKTIATPSPVKKSSKKQTPNSERKARNSTSNNTQPQTAKSGGNAKITSFFGR